MITALRATCGVLLGLLPFAAQAQQPAAPSNEPRTEVKYYDAKWNELPTAAGAEYRFETQYEDSLRGVTRTFYASGARRSLTPYEHVRKGIQHGVSESWYESGQLKWHDNEVHGKREGELRYYYPSGQLKRREQYAAGTRTEGHCFGPDGQPVAFFEFEIMPQPPGGMNGLMRYLGENIRYPKPARRQHVEGRVLLAFIIDPNGQVQDVSVRQSLHPLLDAEAVRVIRECPRWTPGRQDGEAVSVHYMVPVTFVLR